MHKRTFILCVAATKQELEEADYIENLELDYVSDCIEEAEKFENDFYYMFAVDEENKTVWAKFSAAYLKDEDLFAKSEFCKYVWEESERQWNENQMGEHGPWKNQGDEQTTEYYNDMYAYLLTRTDVLEQFKN